MEKVSTNLLCQLPGVNRSAGMESLTQQLSMPMGRRGMEVDITMGMASELDDDNSLE